MTYVDQVAWFGKTTNPTYTPSPSMGFGTLPNGVLGHACYFKDLVFVNNFRQQQKLQKTWDKYKVSNLNVILLHNMKISKLDYLSNLEDLAGASVVWLKSCYDAFS